MLNAEYYTVCWYSFSFKDSKSSKFFSPPKSQMGVSLKKNNVGVALVQKKLKAKNG